MKIVGIGASAGGLDAVIRMFSKLPADSGGAFVLVQHLSPSHVSVLDELLDRHTDMKVIMVSDSLTPLKPNHVYVVPGNAYASLRKDALHLDRQEEGQHLHRPIDHFFESLSSVKDGFSICVILSGTGTDGSRGALSVREEGGLVLVQDPETAEFDGMPRATISKRIADAVLPPEKLGERLGNILDIKGKVERARDLLNLQDNRSKSQFEQVLSTISQQVNVQFHEYREPTLLRRLEKRMLLHQTTDVEEYLNILRNDPNENFALRTDFLIGVTRFWRDEASFKELVKQGFPQLFERENLGDQIRIWIPACSTGEEAYTMAILLEEYMETHNTRREYKIFATDVNPTSIVIGREGIYPEAIRDDVPHKYLHRYFREEERGLQVIQRIRDRILFTEQDVLSDPPFIRVDLICCRNFLIYIKPKAQNRVLSTFHFAIQPGGVLMLGPSESLGALKSGFDTLHSRWNIFIKNTNQSTATYHKLRSTGQVRISSPGKPVDNSSKHSSRSVNTAKNTISVSDPFTQFLIEQYAPTHLFVTGNMDILYLNGHTERILAVPRSMPRFNLHQMLPAEHVGVFEQGVQRALQTNESQSIRGIKFEHIGTTYVATLSFRVVDFMQVEEEVVYITIDFVNQPGGEEHPAQNPGQEFDQKSIISAQVEKLQSELRRKRHEARQLIAELEATNEELQASNRELMASNEELQSTNEELQSVNEELYTVNLELQNKNEELILFNTDLDNLLKSTEIGTIFLDKNLRIRRFTPAIKQQFDLVESDVGRSILSFSSNIEGIDLRSVAKDVINNKQSVEREVRDLEDKPYLLRIHPYLTDESQTVGLVMTFINISDLVAARAEKIELAERFRSIVDLSDNLIVVLQPDCSIISSNRTLMDVARNELVGRDMRHFLEKHTSKNLAVSVGRVMKKGVFENLTLELNHHKSPDACDIYNVSIIPHANDPLMDGYDSVMLLGRNVTNDPLPHINMESKREIYASFMAHARRQIILIDRNLHIVAINHTRYSSKTLEEITGTDLLNYVPDSHHDQYRKAVKRVFAGDDSSRFSVNYSLENIKEISDHIIVEQTVTPIRINGEVAYAAIMGYRVS